jgi:hypothetical protein
MSIGKSSLSDALPMDEWQRRRKLQLQELGVEPIARRSTAILRDDLPMADWQRLRAAQAVTWWCRVRRSRATS